jgi:hypothetical protein
MALTDHAFLYDYQTFDKIKETLRPGYFIGVMDQLLKDQGRSYVDENGYYHCKYVDSDDELGYQNESKFEYVINSDYFRDVHFDKSEKSSSVLAAGCSFTFGQGSPEEYTWPRILEKSLLKNNKNYRVFNIGSPGLGISSIINNIMSFIHLYGKPKTIVALFPPISRQFVFHPVRKEYTIFMPNLFYLNNPQWDKFIFKKTKEYIFEDALYQAITQIRMLENFCESSGINLAWTSWEEEELQIYRELNFKYYFEDDSVIMGAEPKETLEVKEEYSQYLLSSRDKHHPGIAHYNNVSLAFLKRISGSSD